MRGVAILLVVLYHNFGFINYFFFGWLGVDLFFVLSGFLITNILVNTVRKAGYLKNFLIKRTLRIFPLYYLTLIIILVLVPLSGFNVEGLNYFLEHQVWLWFYTQNWLFIIHPPGNNLLLAHFWSLAVEEQFYLVWPLVVLFVRKPRILLLLMLVLLIAIISFRCLIWFYKIENLAYFNFYTFTRIDGICIGCIIALLHKINSDILSRFQPLIVLVLAALNFCFFFVNQYNEFSFPYLALIGYSTFAILWGLLVHAGVKQKNKLILSLFSWKPLRFFGTISYGLYVFHWPVYLLLQEIISKQAIPGFNDFYHKFFISVTSVIISIGLSVLSFRFFEKIFLQWRNRFTYLT